MSEAQESGDWKPINNFDRIEIESERLGNERETERRKNANCQKAGKYRENVAKNHHIVDH